MITRAVSIVCSHSTGGDPWRSQEFDSRSLDVEPHKIHEQLLLVGSTSELVH